MDRDDGASTESSERQELVLLDTAHEPAWDARPAVGTAAWEIAEATEIPSGEPAQVRSVQALDFDAIHIAAVFATAVNGNGGSAAAASTQRAWIPEELMPVAHIAPGTEALIRPSEVAGQHSRGRHRLARYSQSTSFMPCAPAAGLLPFDLKAMGANVDRFLTQLADLGKTWRNPRLATKLALSLTTVMILAFELARLQARKSLARSPLESNLPEFLLPPAGDDS
jgi:hypothetical protein